MLFRRLQRHPRPRRGRKVFSKGRGENSIRAVSLGERRKVRALQEKAMEKENSGGMPSLHTDVGVSGGKKRERCMNLGGS